MHQINPAAARWLNQWHLYANTARLCLKLKARPQARLNAQHARTCLRNFVRAMR
jgi:hypothetical protein